MLEIDVAYELDCLMPNILASINLFILGQADFLFISVLYMVFILT